MDGVAISVVDVPRENNTCIIYDTTRNQVDADISRWISFVELLIPSSTVVKRLRLPLRYQVSSVCISVDLVY